MGKHSGRWWVRQGSPVWSCAMAVMVAVAWAPGAASQAEGELEGPAADASSVPHRLTQEELRQQRAEEWRAGGRVPTQADTEATPSAPVVAAPAPQPASAAPSQAPEQGTPAQLEDIRFRGEGVEQQVVVDLTRHASYRLEALTPGRWILDLPGVIIPESLVRTLDVASFGGLVERIHSYRNDGTVRIAIDARPDARVVARDVGDRIVIDVSGAGPADGAEGEAAESVSEPPRVGMSAETVIIQSPDSRAAPQVATLDLDDQGQERRIRYTGRRIQDLDVRELDIRDFLRFLAEAAGVNIVIDNDVTGMVTLRLRDVPWDEALDVVLRANALAMVRRGHVIRVAKQETLDAELQALLERRESLYVPPPLETRLIPVSYATASELSPRAEELLSDRGSASIDARTNVIIVTDEREVVAQVEELIRSLDTQTPQVLIEARIVEATSTYARHIGIQWGGDFLSSSATGNPTGLTWPSSIGLAGGATDQQTPLMGLSSLRGAQTNPNFAVNLPATVGTGAGGALGLTLGSVGNNANLNIRLSALEDTGSLRIISSPRILTLDNREAHIEQGTLIPYSQISAQGVQTAFQEAKLNLTVTPHVTADGGVLMKLKLTRDEPDFAQTGARGDPTILKREAETELLIMDGHTAVIGGIYTRNTGLNYNQIPLLGDIPVLGWLFKARRDTDRRTELLIFITPRIMNRAESIGL
ncbi:MAG: type IV pilus secretin PilQ [Deltaproteobacteria bacterium]|nr:type IV pilus secretin PilQ [Deltaproteobacteria bacterium]